MVAEKAPTKATLVLRGEWRAGASGSWRHSPLLCLLVLLLLVAACTDCSALLCLAETAYRNATGASNVMARCFVHEDVPITFHLRLASGRLPARGNSR